MNNGLNKNRHQDLGTARNYQAKGYELNRWMAQVIIFR